MKDLKGCRKGKWILLPVEIRLREFDGRLLLACCAVERGYNVIIGKKNALTRLYPALPRGLIVDRSLSGFREAEFRTLCNAGFRLAASDEESFIFYRDLERGLQQRIDESTLALADLYFTFGKKQAELIADHFPAYRERLVVSGTYRTDLLRPEFESLYADTISDIRRHVGRYILWPSNFSSIIGIGGDRNWVAQQTCRQGGTRTDEQMRFFESYLDNDEKSFEAYLKALPEVARAFPEHSIVVRPHPGENPEFWKAFQPPANNVHVVLEGTAIPWLLAADAMYHHGCTTGLEAFLLGRPAIAFHPYYDPGFHRELSTLIGPVARDSRTLIELLKRGIAGEELPRDDPSWLDDYLKTSGPGLASDAMMDAIDGLDWPEDSLFSGRRLPRYMAAELRRRVNLAMRRIRSRVRNEPIVPGSGTLRWGYMTPADIERMIEGFRKATGRFGDIKFEVRKLQGQVFCIHAADG